MAQQSTSHVDADVLHEMQFRDQRELSIMQVKGVKAFEEEQAG